MAQRKALCAVKSALGHTPRPPRLPSPTALLSCRKAQRLLRVGRGQGQASEDTHVHARLFVRDVDRVVQHAPAHVRIGLVDLGTRRHKLLHRSEVHRIHSGEQLNSAIGVKTQPREKRRLQALVFTCSPSLEAGCGVLGSWCRTGWRAEPNGSASAQFSVQKGCASSGPHQEGRLSASCGAPAAPPEAGRSRPSSSTALPSGVRSRPCSFRTPPRGVRPGVTARSVYSTIGPRPVNDTPRRTPVRETAVGVSGEASSSERPVAAAGAGPGAGAGAGHARWRLASL